MTRGEKFGADFLAYPGDPIRHHAQYLVICDRQMGEDGDLSREEMSRLLRLSSSVKKKVLLAKMGAEKNVISYETISWDK